MKKVKKTPPGNQFLLLFSLVLSLLVFWISGQNEFNPVLDQLLAKIQIKPYYRDSVYRFQKEKDQIMWWLDDKNKKIELKGNQALTLFYKNAYRETGIPGSFPYQIINDADRFFLDQGFDQLLFAYSDKDVFLNDLVYAYQKGRQRCEVVVGTDFKNQIPQDKTILIICNP